MNSTGRAVLDLASPFILKNYNKIRINDVDYLYNAPIGHLRWFVCIFAYISLRAIPREVIYSQEGPEYFSVNTFDSIVCI
jgi:hypothetical protein